jgi:hypothetical protein
LYTNIFAWPVPDRPAITGWFVQRPDDRFRSRCQQKDPFIEGCFHYLSYGTVPGAALQHRASCGDSVMRLRIEPGTGPGDR